MLLASHKQLKVFMLLLQMLRKSRFKTIWNWGKSLYRWSALGYGAVQLHENPWLVRAVCTAIWASTRLAFGFIYM